MLKKFFANKLYKNYREQLLLLLDLTLVFLSYIIAYWSKNDFRFSFYFDLKMMEIIASIFVALIVYIFWFWIFKVYKSLWKYIGVNELIRLGASNVLATITIMVFTQVFFHVPALISLELIAGIFALIFMTGLRACYRFLRRIDLSEYEDDDAQPIRVIIVGAGDSGNLLLKELEQNSSLKYKIVGFVDDYKKNIMIGGYKILGTTRDIPSLIEKYQLDGALISMSKVAQKELRRIYDTCIENHLETKIMNFAFKNDTKNSSLVADIKIEDLLGRGEIHLDQTEISSYLTEKVVAVTGAAGSIGSELCRQIVKFSPKKLVLIDINENSLYMLEQEFRRNIEHGKMNNDIEFTTLIASIRDKKAIDSILTEYHPDVVYHAAAHKHVPLMETRPMEAIKNNVFGTYNVIQSCIEHKIKSFIMISTDKAVNPTNVMGATKRMTEMILQAYGHNGVTKMAAVRFGNVLGSNGSVIPIFKEQIAEGGPITLTSKEIIRYFMTIPEAAQLVLQAGYYADQGDIFVLDMGEPVKIIDLAEKMIRLAGLRPYEDIEIKEIGLRPGEKMFEELRLDNEETTRTKNDLIYRNAAMSITADEIDKRLKELHVLLDCSNLDTKAVKQKILDLIISDES